VEFNLNKEFKMKRISLLVPSAIFLSGFVATASQGADRWRENVTPYLPPHQQVQNLVTTTQSIMNIVDDHEVKREQRKLLKEQRKAIKK
jgi:hypothetical protein